MRDQVVDVRFVQHNKARMLDRLTVYEIVVWVVAQVVDDGIESFRIEPAGLREDCDIVRDCA